MHSAILPDPYNHAIIIYVLFHVSFTDKDTLPSDILIPEFTGNADVISTDLFATSKISRRQLWINTYPRLERPSDESVLLCTHSYMS